MKKFNYPSLNDFITIYEKVVELEKAAQRKIGRLVRAKEETSLLIVYYLHKVKSVITVFNRRLDGKRVGVFASRTPNRLSKIAVQEVRLLKIEENKLYVGGLDAIDESPVLDIKLGLGRRRASGR